MANRCEVCGKALESRKSYAGHMWLAHHKRVGIVADIEEKLRLFADMTTQVMDTQDAIGMLSIVVVNLSEKVEGKDYAKSIQKAMEEASLGRIKLYQDMYSARRKRYEQQHPKQPVKTELSGHRKR